MSYASTALGHMRIDELLDAAEPAPIGGFQADDPGFGFGNQPSRPEPLGAGPGSYVGTVLWFDTSKKFGFIKPDAGGWGQSSHFLAPLNKANRAT